MTLDFMAKRFVEGSSRKSNNVDISFEDGRTTWRYRYSSQSDGLVAEIIDRKGDNFTLILHPRPNGEGKTSHNNRVWAILREVQTRGEDGYKNLRYSSFVQWRNKVSDRKLEVDYVLDKPLKFYWANGKLTIDYVDLESHAVPEAERVVIPEPSDNSNIANEVNRLSLILATV